tara:strand:+ start:4965 stop:6203 length:1239 start_codon:yes stop_codon:yes gene_type:complete
MKNSKELKELRSDLIGELESIKVLAETESRDLNKEENTKLDALLIDIDENDIAIKRAEKIETNLKLAAAASGAVVTPVDTDKATRTWSLFKAVNEIRKGGLTGVEAEMHQEAEKENRGQLEGIGLPAFMTEKRASPITAAGSAIAPSVTNAFVDELLEGSLWNRVGLTNLGNLTANTVVPITNTAAVAWEAENAAANDVGNNFNKVTLSPQRVSGYADLSNVLLMQNGQAAEAAVLRDMGRQVAKIIDTNMWSTADQASGPGSIPATTDVLTFTEATFGAGSVASDMLEAIQTIANNHGLDGNLGFVNSFTGYSAVKQASLVGSVSPLYQDDRLAGYPGYFSGAATGIAGTSFDGMFGDFSQIQFASFGPSSIIVDNMTRALNNEVRLVLNQHYDWKLAQGAAFVKYTTLLA